MAALKLLAAAAALTTAAPSDAPTVMRWQPYIAEASLRFGVPESWIERVMQAESNGQTSVNGRPIRSRAGAIGLMQLMPVTWQAMRQSLGLGSNPDDPRDNILAGTFYLRSMYERFGYPGLFAAYNAGPARYAAHVSTGEPLPAETVAYLAKVDRSLTGSTGWGAEHKPDLLFAIRREQNAASGTDSRATSVFAVKNDGP
jgi:soluble lytic murein transglycosylase-like protein